MKVCNTCNEEKPESEFYRRSKTNPRLQGECKPCKRAADNKRLFVGVGLEGKIGSPLRPHLNSVFAKVIRLPHGHPDRERYFSERTKALQDAYAMEIWNSSGQVSGSQIVKQVT